MERRDAMFVASTFAVVAALVLGRMLYEFTIGWRYPAGMRLMALRVSAIAFVALQTLLLVSVALILGGWLALPAACLALFGGWRWARKVAKRVDEGLG